ncbi:guanine nucleotide-exchange factor SEC12, putative [Plasmodium chabaudi chabaudi]|uniref:Guanine nucleotide-exchange factor SEC12, putative n=2 Tax=Plasmodium chabaudi TaxID=5825 RepID=A0A077XEF3_PLACU|nr:guanine nucleotide-exchange factor SEC12, putative [Plasmodium chabaudi chabaudi]SCM20886.1 guanine nucleotide-exchange factor SEC12, putative [Plasmodium chabaudi adami]SCM21911.1 guanine nucleotide-exchange factor SEC12, putative [Plasmodium chabaudi chabaudi]SCN60266.1 guanine nucleotide-exchange factor SEC12, putative [Plasmodium chabaudi chabaudi]VTZ68735.1 guanine nucleotide-exchange factor SEC12, putative [Plasmodium chabaudi chabaudi]|eukprot:XP_016655344.1 guanine nucleotide-exchange factor SEC12, putative [Plasmodium chabaudi chabaudi]
MDEVKVSYLNYPIYGIGSNEKYVVTSGGGGGKNYGIEDILDINTFDEKEKKLQQIWSTTEQNGVVDGIIFVDKYNLWLGSVRNECIIFQINEENGPNILLNFVTDNCKKNARQTVVRFSSNSNLILTGGEDKIVKLWKLTFSNKNKHKFVINDLYIDPKKAIEHIGDFKGHEDCIKDCDISKDEKIVCTCSSDNSLKIWDTNSFVNLHTEQMKNPKNNNEKLNFRCCKFLKNVNNSDEFTYKLLTTAYTSRGNSYLIIWNIYYNDKKEKFTCEKYKFIWLDDRPCCNIAISKDEKYIALGFSTGALKIYNYKYSLLAHYKKHELPITAMCFIKNDDYLLSAGADYSISCTHINSFSFRYLRKIWKVSITMIILLILTLILLDCFNAGYDIRMNNLIRDFSNFGTKKKNNTTIKSKNHTTDEL